MLAIITKYNLDPKIFSIWKVLKFIAEGKDGHVLKVKKGNQIGALKIFKNTKSIKKIIVEINFHKTAAQKKLAPPILSKWEITNKTKCYVTSFLPFTLKKILFDQNKILLVNQIKRIIYLFTELDKLKILHNDDNITRNILSDINGVFYLIDFGFSNKLKKNDTNYRLLAKLNNITNNNFLKKFISNYEEKTGTIIDLHSHMKVQQEERLKKRIAQLSKSTR
jgi:predicted Ser/Thr protein kinase